MIEFFFHWQRSDYDPRFSPDGKPWLDQDSEFWNLVWYVRDLWDWAEHRAANPVMQARVADLSMKDL